MSAVFGLADGTEPVPPEGIEMDFSAGCKVGDRGERSLAKEV